jgi:hypothetical protein
MTPPCITLEGKRARGGRAAAGQSRSRRRPQAGELPPRARRASAGLSGGAAWLRRAGVSPGCAAAGVPPGCYCAAGVPPGCAAAGAPPGSHSGGAARRASGGLCGLCEME